MIYQPYVNKSRLDRLVECFYLTLYVQNYTIVLRMMKTDNII